MLRTQCEKCDGLLILRQIIDSPIKVSGDIYVRVADMEEEQEIVICSHCGKKYTYIVVEEP